MTEFLPFLWMAVFLLIGIAIGFFLGKAGRQGASASESPEFRQLESENTRIQSERKELMERERALLQENAALKQKQSDLEERMTARTQELQQTTEQLRKDFELMANKIFESKSKSFQEDSAQRLGSLLEPFRHTISEFRKTVEETHTKETAQLGELSGHVKLLTELNSTITKETRQLTEALKGESKTQGNWGELVLERILEQSGLAKGLEYETQVSLSGEDGQRIQPDVVIKLPEGRHLIIDSKVSLKAYEQYFGVTEEQDKQRLMALHVSSIRSHIKGLSEKSYPSAKGVDSPDFVLMFIPIESSFGMAVQADQALFDFAWERRIVMVTPSTLLATLRTINNIWKHEKQNRNAIEIAQEAGKLYDKFAGLLDDLRNLGRQFETAQKTYHSALNKLAEGRGNVISKVERLKELGVEPKKGLKEVHPELHDKALGGTDDED